MTTYNIEVLYREATVWKTRFSYHSKETAENLYYQYIATEGNGIRLIKVTEEVVKDSTK